MLGSCSQWRLSPTDYLLSNSDVLLSFSKGSGGTTFNRGSGQSVFPVLVIFRGTVLVGKWERAGPLAVLACSACTRYDRISEVVFHKHFCLVAVLYVCSV